jgi:CDGSH-type Zn-finger protein
MPRLVRHEAIGPIEIKPHPQSVWVCACGLSQKLPHCDGSHAKTRGEQPGKLCIYDKRRSVVERTITDA